MALNIQRGVIHKTALFFWKTFKAARLAFTLGLAVVDFVFTMGLPSLFEPERLSFPKRAIWMRRQGRRLSRALSIEVRTAGTLPTEGVLVSNHLSYTDILVLGSCIPLVFIAKFEVKSWPVIGLLTEFAGSIYIKRDLRSDVARVAKEMPAVLESGAMLAFYPEGTSTGGDRVLSFRTPLLAPASERGWTITPAALRYELAPGDGSVEEEVAYWRDMEFGPHLLNLLGKRRIRVTVTFGKSKPAGKDRKALAVRLREEVCALGGWPVEMAAPEKNSAELPPDGAG